MEEQKVFPSCLHNIRIGRCRLKLLGRRLAGAPVEPPQAVLLIAVKCGVVLNKVSYIIALCRLVVDPLAHCAELLLAELGVFER